MESGKVRNTFVRRLTRQCSQLLNASYEHEAIGFPPQKKKIFLKIPTLPYFLLSYSMIDISKKDL